MSSLVGLMEFLGGVFYGTLYVHKLLINLFKLYRQSIVTALKLLIARICLLKFFIQIFDVIFFQYQGLIVFKHLPFVFLVLNGYFLKFGLEVCRLLFVATGQCSHIFHFCKMVLFLTNETIVLADQYITFDLKFLILCRHHLKQILRVVGIVLVFQFLVLLVGQLSIPNVDLIVEAANPFIFRSYRTFH